MARKQQSNTGLGAGAREVKIYGENACRALWERRRDDIIRVYVLGDLKGQWGSLLKWCASQRRAYHLVESEEMERVSGSQHHEGICLLVRERSSLSEQQLPEILTGSAPKILVYLDGVDNPHNVGAILRVCAHFSVSAVLVPAKSKISLSGSTCRVAEGGAEVVPIISVQSVSKTLQTLRSANFKILATSSHTNHSLFDQKLHGNVLIFFGSEGQGLSAELLKLADSTIAVPGSGSVESLNVACASSVILGEWWRQNH